MSAKTSDSIDAKALENGQASTSEVKDLLNGFKGKVRLVQQMKGFAKNNTKETSTTAYSVGNYRSTLTPFIYVEPNSNSQKCIKFLQADRKQCYQFGLIGVSSYPVI